MTERPIIFGDDMVRAILSGAKTQTRRPAKPQPRESIVASPWGRGWFDVDPRAADGGDCVLCPFGAPGDTLWVRECFALGRVFDRSRAAELPIVVRDVPVWYRADGATDESWANRGKLRPSVHMPRWASRVTLRVTDVRVERVQDITEVNARAEGVYPLAGGYCAGDADAEWYSTALGAFADLWCSTYGVQSWTANPWVWTVTFERIDKEGCKS